jgi:hypothetical protein
MKHVKPFYPTASSSPSFTLSPFWLWGYICQHEWRPFAKQHTDTLTELLAHQLRDYQSTDARTKSLTHRSFDQTNRLTHRPSNQANRSRDKLTNHPSGWLSEWFTGWPTYCLTDCQGVHAYLFSECQVSEPEIQTPDRPPFQSTPLSFRADAPQSCNTPAALTFASHRILKTEYLFCFDTPTNTALLIATCSGVTGGHMAIVCSQHANLGHGKA